MGWIDELIRDLVPIADELTDEGGLQLDVSHFVWRSQTQSGAATYASAVPVRALVDLTTQKVRTNSGELINVRAGITFLRPVLVNAKDKFVLPNGLTGPVVHISGGLMDPTTNAGYVTDVWLG